MKTQLEFETEALATFIKKGFTVVGDVVTPVDEDEKVPSKEDWDKKTAEIKAEYDAKEYQRTRAASYPEIGDQLDALYHAGVFPSDMAAKIKKVKDDNPKG